MSSFIFGLFIFLIGAWIIGAIVNSICKFLKKPDQKSNFQSADLKISTQNRTSQSKQQLFPSSSNRSGDRTQHESNLWIPFERSIEVHGLTINGGMLYFGRKLNSVSASGNKYLADTEPALINPSLSAIIHNPDVLGSTMGYWPSYSSIQPQARGGYLQWLSKGRNNPEAYIGFVFLFFYGLERRVLFDIANGLASLSELPGILAEVERLLSLYRKNRSFRQYATDFLDHCLVRFAPEKIFSSPYRIRNIGVVPATLRYALAVFANKKEPISCAWAIAWAYGHPDIKIPSAIRRCPAEFAQLFRIKYNEKYGQGFLPPTSSSKLIFTYQPASASFGGPVTFVSKELKDVSRFAQPGKKLQAIIDICAQELKEYSRCLARKDSGGFKIISALPQALLSKSKSKEVSELLNLLGDVDSIPTLVNTSDLLHILGLGRDGKIPKKDAVSMAEFLEKLWYGMAPDARISGCKPDIAGKVAVFKITHPVNSLSVGFSAASTALQLAAAIAYADGTVASDEKRYLEEHLANAFELPDYEKNRLQAELKWLLSAPPALGGVKAKIEALDVLQKDALARLLVSVAQVDGTIDGKEMSRLKWSLKLMGLSDQDLYKLVHEARTTNGASKETSNATTGFQIERPTAEYQKAISGAALQACIQLDKSKVEHILSDTKAASKILTVIFSQEEPENETVIKTASTDSSIISGLDENHSALLLHLVEKEEWQVTEFESLCREWNLMPSGAIETINEVAYKISNAPVIEEDCGFRVDLEIYEEIRAAS